MKLKWLSIALIVLSNACSSFIYYPKKEILRTPSIIPLQYTPHLFKTTDKLKLYGWHIPSSKNLGTVIFFHGNGGNISNRMHTIRIINDLGFNLFIFDYRGYGLSQGTPSFEGLKRDAFAAWNYVHKNMEKNANRIIIWGRSLGGSVAAFLSSQKKCSLLIIESTFTSFKDIAGDFCLVCPLFINSRIFNTKSHLNKSLNPILLIHSLDDSLIDYNHALLLFRKIKNIRAFITIRGPHNGGFIFSGELYKKKIEYFLKNILKLNIHKNKSEI